LTIHILKKKETKKSVSFAAFLFKEKQKEVRFL